jgi:hypothetical protein
MNALIKISVEQSTRVKDGWLCDTAEYGLEDCTGRFVTEAEMLAHLGADKAGLIEQVMQGPRDCNGMWDERFWYITLAEWEAEVTGIELDNELARLINKREGRTTPFPRIAFKVA